jgi:hypothetical protein
MIRKTLYATAIVTFGLVVGASAYSASASESADDRNPVVSTSTAPSADDNGGRLDRDQRVEPGDDRRVNGGASATATPRPTNSTDSAEPGDDNGGRLDRDQRFEPGDDRRVNGQGGARIGDDDGRHDDADDHVSDDSGSDDHGSDDSGRGSDDSGSDDHGSDG